MADQTSEPKIVTLTRRDPDEAMALMAARVVAAENRVDELERRNALLEQILREGRRFVEHLFPQIVSALSDPADE